MTNLALLMKAKSNRDQVYALNIINEDKKESSVKNAEKILSEASKIAASSDVALQPLTRYDNDVVDGIRNVIKEKKITDLMIGLAGEKGFSPSFVYNLYNGYLRGENPNILVYHAIQPIATLKKQVVIIPPKAHREPGFFPVLLRIWNISKNAKALLDFYADEATIRILQRIQKKVNIEARFTPISKWEEMEAAARTVQDDEGLMVVMAERGWSSYMPQLQVVPDMLNNAFAGKNYLLFFPGDEKLEEEDVAENRHCI